MFLEAIRDALLFGAFLIGTPFLAGLGLGLISRLRDEG